MYCREFSSIIDPTTPADPFLIGSLDFKAADVTTSCDAEPEAGNEGLQNQQEDHQ